jgi:hypothetical protein
VLILELTCPVPTAMNLEHLNLENKVSTNYKAGFIIMQWTSVIKVSELTGTENITAAFVKC